MRSSSFDYLMALRRGDFLCFLEWPQFIQKKYGKEQKLLSGDMLMDFLIYDWLYYGFAQEDVGQVALLVAISEQKPNSFKSGIYAYSLQTLFSVMLSCMVLARSPLLELAISKESMTGKQILQFIDEKAQLFGNEQFSEALTLMNVEFRQKISQVNKEHLKSVTRKIRVITKCRSTLEEYLLQLELQQQNKDSLHPARFEIAQNFLIYMQEQVEITPEITKKISLYINALRHHNPQPWEEAYLRKISPPTLMENTIGLFSSIGLSFFSMLLSSNAHGESISKPKDTAPGAK
jgi:hypothetical protein